MSKWSPGLNFSPWALKMEKVSIQREMGKRAPPTGRSCLLLLQEVRGAKRAF